MIDNFLDKASKEIEEGRLPQAVEWLDKAYELDKSNIQVLEVRADVLHKLNRLADALNDLNRYLALKPNDDKVKTKKELIQIILKNSQLDVYACTNTHLDPWN